MEYPHLSDNVWPTKEGAETKSQIVVKQTEDFGITYSVEWDNSMVANRWTCYTLHADNSGGNSGRDDSGFNPDEGVAVSSTDDDYNSSGFSRGHLCPSFDRQCSEEQNKQTFFLTNIQPQWQKHNGGLWSNLEDLVHNYATKNIDSWPSQENIFNKRMLYLSRSMGHANIDATMYYYTFTTEQSVRIRDKKSNTLNEVIPNMTKYFVDDENK